ncbi:MAG: alpha/beta hydrolase fold domain-containing protein [Acidimicrobiia bacterium]|nr:alpha/beta hydrolase fold domain-containing protein [Acidimicrobiia bacterium]
MRGGLITLRIVLSVVWAVLRRIWHRLRFGPAVAGWAWQVELRMVALRAFLDAARSSPDPRARSRIEENIDPPLPRALRKVLELRSLNMSGIGVEKIEHAVGAIDARSRPTLLYLHGGGYLAGSAATHRRWVARLAWALGAEAFVPNYRLAPKHKFPAALDDAMAVYKGLLAEGVEPERLFVAGDSAGGGLAAALLLRLRDTNEPLPAGGILFSPYADLEHTAYSLAENRATDYLPGALVGVGANKLYLGNHDPRDPYASPLHGRYTGVPPLLVVAGGREMIRDDAVRLVDAAKREGCAATLHIAPDMYHVWPALLPNHPETRRILLIAAQFAKNPAGS